MSYSLLLPGVSRCSFPCLDTPTPNLFAWLTSLTSAQALLGNMSWWDSYGTWEGNCISCFVCHVYRIKTGHVGNSLQDKLIKSYTSPRQKWSWRCHSCLLTQIPFSILKFTKLLWRPGHLQCLWWGSNWSYVDSRGLGNFSGYLEGMSTPAEFHLLSGSYLADM